ncbi:MAG: septal ring lytic transglycosylase RlpA family protein [Candidatus Neomarinimicrobiota bacterium]|jgi:rare lipoprotein A (peptidoglycan hydrolase)|nr:septal ring lytic transglycosylase RlpA family protein [Candidatus Neomarinimicrobiota bacterium]|tara:strand:- start:656 stop:1102 length:447 start_codon:yes stop_codon:yes gene_type:complete
MNHKILLITISLILYSCGPTIAYGDYINSDGMSRKEIEAIRNHPEVQIGIASYYGREFHRKLTANGQRFNMYKVSAAHKTLPLGTRVKVTNLNNGKSIRLTINDRGPFKKGRILDLSYKAAQKLGFVNEGTTKVRIDVIKLGDNKYYK